MSASNNDSKTVARLLGTYTNAELVGEPAVRGMGCADAPRRHANARHRCPGPPPPRGAEPRRGRRLHRRRRRDHRLGLAARPPQARHHRHHRPVPPHLAQEAQLGVVGAAVHLPRHPQEPEPGLPAHRAQRQQAHGRGPQAAVPDRGAGQGHCVAQGRLRRPHHRLAGAAQDAPRRHEPRQDHRHDVRREPDHHHQLDPAGSSSRGPRSAQADLPSPRAQVKGKDAPGGATLTAAGAATQGAVDAAKAEVEDAKKRAEEIVAEVKEKNPELVEKAKARLAEAEELANRAGIEVPKEAVMADGGVFAEKNAAAVAYVK
ncbi:hypothetical protein DFJ74DRAFT_517032 [Hyaloraphidium curvatum]|nr:hypothetical protein DFJ74DRAFT_517032 [Hyaloraphidium curvatum]